MGACLLYHTERGGGLGKGGWKHPIAALHKNILDHLSDDTARVAPYSFLADRTSRWSGLFGMDHRLQAQGLLGEGRNPIAERSFSTLARPGLSATNNRVRVFFALICLKTDIVAGGMLRNSY